MPRLRGSGRGGRVDPLIRARFTTESWPFLLLLSGGLTLLASLYLPWQSLGSCTEQDYQGAPVCGLLNSFSDRQTVDGLSVEVGRAAALLALLLAAFSAAAWARPGLTRRLPLGRCALVTAYLGVAVGVQARSETHQQGIGGSFHFAYGAYVGLAATTVIVVAAGMARRRELERYRSASRLVLLALFAGLLGAFLLTWVQESVSVASYTVTFADPGIASAAAVVAAALAVCLPLAWSKPGAVLEDRLGPTAVVALFTGAAAVSFPPLYGHRVYGAWLALGFAGGLLLFALVDGPRTLRLPQPSWRQLVSATAGALFVASLFLPWERQCYDENSGYGPLGGHCLATNAWTITLPAAAGALLAIALLAAVLEPRRVRLSVIELAAGFGLLVTTLRFGLQEGGGGGFHLAHAYGSTIGLVLAAVFIVLALLGSRLPAIRLRRAAVRFVPIAACAAYLAIIVLPWWGVLWNDLDTPPIYPPLSWLTIAGALLGIHLLGLWSRGIAGAPGRSDLVLVPLALLALASVDLINQREDAARWGRVALVSVCLFLALLGRIEQRGGLENLRIPNALRLDRL